MATAVEVSREFTYCQAAQMAAGRSVIKEISMAKNFATSVSTMVTHEAVQIFGGMGLMDDFPIERFWRDARVERIWDGTSEIQRHIISRELLRPLGA